MGWTPLICGNIVYPVVHSITSSTTQDAINEFRAFIGPILWSGGKPGDTKTISAASGGSIWWLPQVVTWAAAGSTIRVGLTGLSGLYPDGTFTVYKDLVQGTDSLSATPTQTTMGSGTKTITFGEHVAFMVRWQTRNGSDAFRVAGVSAGGTSPYGVYNASAGDTVDSSITVPIMLIVFDDGTYGYMGFPYAPYTYTTTALTAASSGEYGVMFKFPYSVKLSAFIGSVGDLDAGDSAVVSFYAQPESSNPILLASKTFTESAMTGSTTGIALVPDPERILTANTWYAVTLKCSAGSIYRPMITIPSTVLRQFFPFGENVKGITRTGSSGAFTTSLTDITMAGVLIDSIMLPSTVRTRSLRITQG